MLRLFIILAVSSACSAAPAAERIGLALPLSGPEAPIARRIEFGVGQAKLKISPSAALTLVDDDCDAEGAADAVDRLRDARVQIVIGPLCTASAETLAAALPGIPVLSFDTRNPLIDRRRSVDALALYELGSSPNAYSEAVIKQMVPAFSGKPWAMIDDGSLGARSLSDAVRLLVEETSARPVEIANFRPLQRTQKPLLRRLARSGVEALLVAGSAEDVATISADLAELGFDWTLGTMEAAELLPYVENADAVANGTLALLPRPLPEAAASLAVQNEDDPEAALAIGHAMMEIAVAYDPAKAMMEQRFDTVLGVVRFDAEGRHDPRPPLLHVWRDGAFEPVSP